MSELAPSPFKKENKIIKKPDSLTPNSSSRTTIKYMSIFITLSIIIPLILVLLLPRGQVGNQRENALEEMGLLNDYLYGIHLGVNTDNTLIESINEVPEEVLSSDKRELLEESINIYQNFSREQVSITEDMTDAESAVTIYPVTVLCSELSNISSSGFSLVTGSVSSNCTSFGRQLGTYILEAERFNKDKNGIFIKIGMREDLKNLPIPTGGA